VKICSGGRESVWLIYWPFRNLFRRKLQKNSLLSEMQIKFFNVTHFRNSLNKLFYAFYWERRALDKLEANIFELRNQRETVYYNHQLLIVHLVTFYCKEINIFYLLLEELKLKIPKLGEGLKVFIESYNIIVSIGSSLWLHQ